MANPFREELQRRQAQENPFNAELQRRNQQPAPAQQAAPVAQDTPARRGPSMPGSQRFPDRQPSEGQSPGVGGIQGLADVTSSIASSAVAEPIAGFAGIAGGVLPGEQGQAARYVEATRNAISRDPSTPQGQAALQAVGRGVQGAVDAVNYPISGLAGLAELGAGQGIEQAAQTARQIQEQGVSQVMADGVFEATGSPELAAMAATLPTATLEAIGLRGVRGTGGGGGNSTRGGPSLSQASPSIQRLKQRAGELYTQVDEAGVRVDQNDFLDFAVGAREAADDIGFDPQLTPKSNALLHRIEDQLGEEVTISDLQKTRRAAQVAAGDIENRVDAAIGTRVIERIDDLIDQQGARIEADGNENVGQMFREANTLWGRARRAEVIDEAMTKAQNQASGFENGIRIQMRQILNNKRKRRGFSADEQEAMRKVIQGGPLENTLKFMGKFGLTEGQRTSALMGLMGAGAGYSLMGGPGAVLVPAVGQVSMQLAQRLTRNNAKFVDDLVKSGKNGQEITKAYLRNTPKDKRSVSELTELLIRPGIDVGDVGTRGPDSQFVRDARYAADELKQLGATSLAAVPGIIEGTTEEQQ